MPCRTSGFTRGEENKLIKEIKLGFLILDSLLCEPRFMHLVEILASFLTLKSQGIFYMFD